LAFAEPARRQPANTADLVRAERQQRTSVIHPGPRLERAEPRSAAAGGGAVQFAVVPLPVALQDRQALLLQQLRGQPLPFAPQRVPVPQGVVVGERTDDRIRHASSYLPDESVLTQRARRAGRAAEPNRELWTTPLAVDNQ